MKREKILNFIIEVFLLAVLFTGVEYFIAGGLLDMYYQINLTSLCINIILAVSLNLINGFTGQLSLGHAGFMGVGAYAAVYMTVMNNQSLLAAAIAAALAAGLAGFLIGVPTLRLKGDYLAIATLGFGEIIRVILYNIDYLGGPAGISGIPQYTTWPVLFIGVLVTVLIIQNLINSSYGRAIISVREDEIAAEIMGINTTGYKVLAFVVGAAFAGVAGALYAHYFYIIKPDNFGFMKSFDILVMVVLGGLGSTTGAILAAIFITLLNAFLQKYAAMRMIIYAALLIAVMIYRPQGLMGNKEWTIKSLNRIWGGKLGADADRKDN